jgi:hypothetical protein
MPNEQVEWLGEQKGKHLPRAYGKLQACMMQIKSHFKNDVGARFGAFCMSSHLCFVGCMDNNFGS